MACARGAPTTRSAAVGSLRPGRTVALTCKTTGEDVEGNSLWYRLDQDPAGWATARYIDNLGPVPVCPDA
ncbi:SH3 domain-containing protein [Streptomyces sp. NBC_01198]|uniref:SH3 domain-containing protein n=1 Tax=Streptomyces sp. NBC_01198 TaxID=2903769 RepID=UPI002E0F8A02|nr:SH3 domain-containing protein [Streptomyces sp. NBC_01198]